MLGVVGEGDAVGAVDEVEDSEGIKPIKGFALGYYCDEGVYDDPRLEISSSFLFG